MLESFQETPSLMLLVFLGIVGLLVVVIWPSRLATS